MQEFKVKITKIGTLARKITCFVILLNTKKIGKSEFKTSTNALFFHFHRIKYDILTESILLLVLIFEKFIENSILYKISAYQKLEVAMKNSIIFYKIDKN